MAAVDAEYCGKLGAPVTPVFAEEEAIGDDHTGAAGVVGCGVGAVMAAAVPVAGGAPLLAALWSLGAVEGFILAWKASRLVTCGSGYYAVNAHVGRAEGNAGTGRATRARLRAGARAREASESEMALHHRRHSSFYSILCLCIPEPSAALQRRRKSKH